MPYPRPHAVPGPTRPQTMLAAYTTKQAATAPKKPSNQAGDCTQILSQPGVFTRLR